MHDKIRSIILSKKTDPVNRKVGIEEEIILHTNDNKRLPVNPGNFFSCRDLLKILNDENNGIGIYSLEPGGQIEWSSPPHRNLNTLNQAMQKHHMLIEKVAFNNNLKIIDYALEPIYRPDEVELINEKKYHLMDKNMVENGEMGRWMMRNTASIQVNFDTVGLDDVEKMAFIADCIHPIAAYLFANCPYKEKLKTGLVNIRNLIWEKTDNKRCRNLFDHRIESSRGLVNKYIEYILDVPNIFQIDRKGNIVQSNGTIKDRLKNLMELNSLTIKDINVALHQIFTNVRLKDLVEVRGSDRTPRGFEMSPVAFWVGLLTDMKVRDNLYNILYKWSKKDRLMFNNSAFELNKEQPGPEGKSYGEWVKIIGNLALEGLKNRNLNEEKLFEKFYYTVLNNGPFSLQTQENGPTYNP
ncbi:MAG: glutamate-cysteine ligase family protein [Candidatus Neomarinimicrobiota bacterium]